MIVGQQAMDRKVGMEGANLGLEEILGALRASKVRGMEDHKATWMCPHSSRGMEANNPAMDLRVASMACMGLTDSFRQPAGRRHLYVPVITRRAPVG